MDKEEKLEENEESIKEILDIVKDKYNQYYERTQSIDNKNGFFIAFHGAVLLLLVNPDNINKSAIIKLAELFIFLICFYSCYCSLLNYGFWHVFYLFIYM